jgi:hypothetical protein
MRPKRGGVALAAGFVALAIPAPVGAATTIGGVFPPTAAGCSGTFIQVGSPNAQYAAPTDGVITSWQHQSNGPLIQLRLKAARPGGGNVFTIVGESALETTLSNTLNTYLTRIPVHAGDLLGAFFNGAGGCVSTPTTGYVHKAVAGDRAPQRRLTLAPGLAHPSSMSQLCSSLIWTAMDSATRPRTPARPIPPCKETALLLWR